MSARTIGLHAFAIVAWILLAVHVYGLVLSLGFMADDLFQISLLEGLFGPHSPLDLYAFGPPDPAAVASHRARGSLPWWTVDEFRFAMLRPLSSALLFLDHRIAPRAAVLHHVHSLVWFVAALLALAAWLRRLGVPPLPAAMTVTIYLVSETHTWLIAWLANRCGLVSLTFCLLALHRHACLRGPGGRVRDAWIEGGLWALAWAGGEYAAGGLGLLLADELVPRPGSPRRSWRARGLALVPGLVPLAAYAGVYVALRYGVYGATTYIDPIHDPRAFVETLGHRIGRMPGEVWLQVIAEPRLLAVHPEGSALVRWIAAEDVSETVQAWRHAAVVTTGAIAVVALAWGLGRRAWHDHERRALVVVALGSVLACVPVAAVPPGVRTLAVANVAPALWLALVSVAAVRVSVTGPLWPRSGWVLARIVGLWALTVVGLWAHVAAEFQRVRTLEWFLVYARLSEERLYGNPAFVATPIAGRHVIVIAAPGLVQGIHGFSMMNLLGRPLPSSWHVLSIGTSPHLVRRLGSHALQLDAVGAVMQRGPEAELFRAPAQTLRQGQVVDVGLFRAAVTRVRPGVGPAAITFTFDRPLDDPSLVFLVIGPEGLEPFTLPSGNEIAAVKPALMPKLVFMEGSPGPSPVAARP